MLLLKHFYGKLCTDHAEQVEGCYEMSVGNADKGMLPVEEIRRRVQPFIDENLPLVLTQVYLLQTSHLSLLGFAMLFMHDVDSKMHCCKAWACTDDMRIYLPCQSYRVNARSLQVDAAQRSPNSHHTACSKVHSNFTVTHSSECWQI